MASTPTRLLLTAATFLGGILAGTIVDRVIVGGPAWHELGVEAWMQFSRHADLGTGLIAYPVEGIGATLLVIAATVSHYLDRTKRRAATMWLSFAAVFSAIGLLLTVKAAPIMLSLGTPQPASALRHAFDDFFFWGLYLRGFAYTLAFLAEILAFFALSAKREIPIR